MSELEDLERRLKELESERETLQGRIRLFRAKEPEAVPVEFTAMEPRSIFGTPASDLIPETPGQKIELFLKLFRCRESVYPKRWESKVKGKKGGYSPACNNEWVRGVCWKKPNGNVKCIACPNQAFPRLDAAAVDRHLRGQHTIGTYAIREDDACVFLACDFDGKGWQSDVFIYQAVASEMGVEALVERSRSGNGAHAWIFFSEPVPARMAREFGTAILLRCGEVNNRVDLESYDRFFPNQEYLPKGGFGNLIALPLQKLPRDSGNSVFIGPDMKPEVDQWRLLSKVRRLSLLEVRRLIDQHLPRRSEKPDADEDASLSADRNVLESGSSVADILPTGTAITVSRGAQVSIPLDGLPLKLVKKLKRCASFSNPEFYTLQRMRMETFPKRRFLFSGELREDELMLARGVFEKAVEVLRSAGASVTIQEKRTRGKRLKLEFSGTLTPPQEEAVSALKKHDQGILVAPPGVGKTVMACALIAKRKVSTLVLVHKQHIMDQWKASFEKFLGMNQKEIGMLGGGKKKRTGKLDIVMMQTLAKSQEMEEIVAGYGQVIVDECHHIPATSFEDIMKQVPAKFILGLTATPYRKDRLEKILFHQCGQVKHEIKSADGGKLGKSVTFRETGFRLPDDIGSKPPYHLIAELVTTDPRRNATIAADIVSALKAGRFPLVISDRKVQLDSLLAMVAESAKTEEHELAHLRTFRLEGKMSAKGRRKILAEIGLTREEGIPLVVFATASLIGEGFDMPELDALILAIPRSFEGNMVQFAGRLHRLAEGKENVIIYDYVDSYCAVFIKMYRERIKAYQNMGYKIDEPEHFFGGKSMRQEHLFL
jgi:superfamily II DNA or RNA helicase